MTIRTIRRRAGRRGFTLIELLVVIAIIAVLMGLLMSGVMAVLAARDRAANQFDLNKLDEGMQVATQKYGGAKTLPGMLVVCNNMGAYSPAAAPPAGISAQQMAFSREAMRKMFGPRLLEPDLNGQYNFVSWDGTNNNSLYVLEGQQCLVFYLGGMPLTANGLTKMTGFSADPRNPAAAGGERIGPFYNFESNRLSFSSAGKSVAPAPWCPAYLDRYGTPFAYFGGSGAANTYKSYCPSLPCPSNPTVGPVAYFETQANGVPVRFTKPDSWQILSAGKDRVFAPGGLWDPTKGSTDPAARFNVSNFSAVSLNNPQQ